jgi:RimJ/RimL family protein N-acetyltransferase
VFRGFTNIGADDGVLLTVLGQDDNGGIIWGPQVLREAAAHGLYLTADNRLIDTVAGDEVPDDVVLIKPMPQEEIDRFFATRLLSGGSVAYGIHERGPERLIGLTTFSSLDGDNGSVLFHITIGERDAWGRGLGSEATELMLEHAFERLGLHRVGLSVFSYNLRAIRAYEKAGFRIEGRQREAILRDGRYWDEIQMGVLVDEWVDRRYGHLKPSSVVDEALVP